MHIEHNISSPRGGRTRLEGVEALTGGADFGEGGLDLIHFGRELGEALGGDARLEDRARVAEVVDLRRAEGGLWGGGGVGGKRGEGTGRRWRRMRGTIGAPTERIDSVCCRIGLNVRVRG